MRWGIGVARDKPVGFVGLLWVVCLVIAFVLGKNVSQAMPAAQRRIRSYRSNVRLKTAPTAPKLSLEAKGVDIEIQADRQSACLGKFTRKRVFDHGCLLKSIPQNHLTQSKLIGANIPGRAAHLLVNIIAKVWLRLR